MQQRVQKSTWLITYGAAGPDLDAAKFNEYQGWGSKVDEWYSVNDGSYKYTLVHFDKKIRKSAVEIFMSYASNRYGIFFRGIYGCGIVTNNSSNELYSHVGFQLLIQSKKNMNPLFSFWVKSPYLRGGGIIKRYLRNYKIPGMESAGHSNVSLSNGEGAVMMSDGVKKRKVVKAVIKQKTSPTIIRVCKRHLIFLKLHLIIPCVKSN